MKRQRERLDKFVFAAVHFTRHFVHFPKLLDAWIHGKRTAFVLPSQFLSQLPFKSAYRACPSNAASQKSLVIRPGKTMNSDNPSAESIPRGFSVLTRTNSRPFASWNLSILAASSVHGVRSAADVPV